MTAIVATRAFLGAQTSWACRASIADRTAGRDPAEERRAAFSRMPLLRVRHAGKSPRARRTVRGPSAATCFRAPVPRFRSPTLGRHTSRSRARSTRSRCSGTRDTAAASSSPSKTRRADARRPRRPLSPRHRERRGPRNEQEPARSRLQLRRQLLRLRQLVGMPARSAGNPPVRLGSRGRGSPARLPVVTAPTAVEPVSDRERLPWARTVGAKPQAIAVIVIPPRAFCLSETRRSPVSMSRASATSSRIFTASASAKWGSLRYSVR
jgi:hypothetical protein